MFNKQTTVSVEPLTETISNQKNNRIGLLGGTFNPPHIGHLIIADQARNQLGLDEVWFIPTANPPHAYGKTTIDSEYRVDMLVRAISDNSYFDLNTVEIDRGGISYTYDTIVELQSKYPDKEFFYIVGADMVQDLPNWHKIDELMKMVQFVGVNRLKYKRETTYPIIWVDVPDVNISSTELRDSVYKGNSIRYLVPREVIKYIDEKGLYNDEED